MATIRVSPTFLKPRSYLNLLKINLFNRQRDLPIDLKAVRKSISLFLAYKKVFSGEVTVHFVTKRAICKLHAQFFNDPTPTDCISFPYAQEKEAFDPMLGEVFVCPKVAEEYDPENPQAEIILYIVHGLLHLLGYDDQDKKERARMRRAEKAALQLLKLCN